VPTVYRAVKRGEIPLAPIGGRMRVVVTELERLIGRRLTPSDFVVKPSEQQAQTDLLHV
jgi:hypothetical protein